MPEFVWTRPWLYPKQEAALFHSARIGVCEASTKSGKTVGALAWLLEQAFLYGRPGRNYWWVAPVYGQSTIAYSRCKRGLTENEVTYATMSRVSKVTNESEHTVTLPNGAIIWFKSAENPDNLFGEDVYAAVMDEYTRCKQQAWVALRSTLTATRGSARLIGNVKGKRNWGYLLARMAQENEGDDLHYAKITAIDAAEADIFDKDEAEEARKVMPETEWRQLYLAEAADDEGNPFGGAHIMACTRPELSLRPPVMWGWDLAKSSDWTVGIALDENGDACRFSRWQNVPWPETHARITRETSGLPALVDSTGVGDAILGELQLNGGGNFTGYVFTSPSKQRLMEELAASIQSLRISFPEGPISLELDAFEYTYSRTGVSYSAPEGMHDDCVCSLALVNHLFRNRPQAWYDDSGVTPVSARTDPFLDVAEYERMEEERTERTRDAPVSPFRMNNW